MTRVMMCGVRRPEDVGLLAGAGVDAIGLITEVWQSIACNLPRATARELSRLAPPFISTVLIVTEERVDEVCRLVDHVCPTVLQLHGFNTPEDVAALRQRLGLKIVKTLHFQGDRMAEGDDPGGCARSYLAAGADAILLDSFRQGKVGSTGETMSLAVARDLRRALSPAPLILAGGLNADNVAATIRQVLPYAVDTFSGVTTAGYLDADKVTRFMASVRRSSRSITWQPN